MKKLLAITSGIIHPIFIARYRLLQFIKDSREFDVVSAGTIEAAKWLGSEPFDAVLLYFHRRKISGEALESMKDFVHNGGGLLAVHSASASFKQCREYFDFLGGRFTTHDKIMEFEIKQADEGRQIFGDMKPFTVRDELYIHETCDGITTRLYAEHGGNREPIVWTKEHGAGRIFYFEPGHCAGTMKNPAVREVILKGLRWVSRSGEGR